MAAPQVDTTALAPTATETPTTMTIRQALRHHARYAFAKRLDELDKTELWQAVALTVRDRLVDRLLATEERYRRAQAKRMYYLSMEFLIGRSLSNNLQNLGLLDEFRAVFDELGLDFDDTLQREPDAALGNGGLGRLAACFLDSLATLDMPGFGYGINYEYGLFRQEIYRNGQREKPDNWLSYGSPWLIRRPSEVLTIPVYGRIVHAQDRHGNYNPMWLDWKVILAVPHDMPIAGYGGRTVNYLRLYAAAASHDFDMEIFNEGDYFKAVEQKIKTETISMVLYPSDVIESGKELRLIQEYFLVACAIRDIVNSYQRRHGNDLEHFAQQVAIQLNDTHPTLAVAELMRYLIDEAGQPWETAWDTVQAVFGYTNHTLMPEALEKWPVPLLEHVLPRHLQIIYEINRRFLDEVARRWPGDNERLGRMSLIEESTPKQVRMAHLAIVGSHSVNGVAQLHSELVKTQLVPDFYEMWPRKFNNKTNGVTQRRWLLNTNPELANLLTRTVGPQWITDLDQLRQLEGYVMDAGFRDEFLRVKQSNKAKLAQFIDDSLRIHVNPESLFDIQIKRIHEYKRQMLNILHVIHLYLHIIEDDKPLAHPRVCIFSGKAAPGYWAAKEIIRLIVQVAKEINRDRRVHDQLRVVFLPDYRVSLAEVIIPAADLSEQISTAGTEASGTSCMKFAMNGALTMGTLDGANIEIREAVGADNIFIFGLRSEQILNLKRDGAYHPRTYYERNPVIRRVMDTLLSNRFSMQEPGQFAWIFQSLVERPDPYFHLADLEDYLAAQTRAAETFTDRHQWASKAIYNVARIGRFSSDRTIQEYARDIWDIQSIPDEG